MQSYFPGRRFPAFGACINCGHGCVTVVAAVVGAAVARFFNASPDYGCALSLHTVASIFATISAAIANNALDASPCSSFYNGFPLFLSLSAIARTPQFCIYFDLIY